MRSKVIMSKAAASLLSHRRCEMAIASPCYYHQSRAVTVSPFSHHLSRATTTSQFSYHHLSRAMASQFSSTTNEEKLSHHLEGHEDDPSDGGEDQRTVAVSPFSYHLSRATTNSPFSSHHLSRMMAS
ncbi:hypothetical protein LINGRAHAP2_LOCUS30681 [Linum grandiflorum]